VALFFGAGFALWADCAPAGRAGEALSYASLALFTGLALGPPLAQALLREGGFPPGQRSPGTIGPSTAQILSGHALA
jgi:hypothetical protein